MIWVKFTECSKLLHWASHCCSNRSYQPDEHQYCHIIITNNGSNEPTVLITLTIIITLSHSSTLSFFSHYSAACSISFHSHYSLWHWLSVAITIPITHYWGSLLPLLAHYPLLLHRVIISSHYQPITGIFQATQFQSHYHYRTASTPDYHFNKN